IRRLSFFLCLSMSSPFGPQEWTATSFPSIRPFPDNPSIPALPSGSGFRLNGCRFFRSFSSATVWCVPASSAFVFSLNSLLFSVNARVSSVNSLLVRSFPLFAKWVKDHVVARIVKAQDHVHVTHFLLQAIQKGDVRISKSSASSTGTHPASLFQYRSVDICRT